MMDCRQFQEQRFPYLYGVLEAADSHAMEAHAASCASCARILAQGRQATSRLDAWRPEAVPLSARTARRVRLQRAAARRSAAAWLRVAAILAAGVILGVLLFSIPMVRTHVAPRIEPTVTWIFQPDAPALPRLADTAPVIPGTTLPVPAGADPTDHEGATHLADLPESLPALGGQEVSPSAERMVLTPEAPHAALPRDLLAAGGKAAARPQGAAQRRPVSSQGVSHPMAQREEPYGSLSSFIPGQTGLPAAGRLLRQDGAILLATREDVWLPVTMTDAMPAGTFPFRGLTISGQGAVLCRSWFVHRVDETLALYDRQGSRPDFFRPAPDRDLSLQFLCRAFQPDMDAALKNGVRNLSLDAGLRGCLVDRYVRTAAHHAYKQMHRPAEAGQGQPVSLEPLLAAFAYGDAWIALAEACATPGFEHGQHRFTEVFLPATVLGRLAEVVNRPPINAPSLLALSELGFQEYRRLCVQEWITSKGYRLSMHEHLGDDPVLP